MHVRLITRWAALALVPVFGACKDSTTTPVTRAAAPRAGFASVADTVIGGGGGSGNQTHFIASGTSGYVSWFSAGDSSGGGGGFSYGSLNVSRGGATNNPQTFLSYFVEQCGLYYCAFLGGSGLIPNGDLSGGTQQLDLSTNTSGNPNFFTFGGSPGLISVDWRANGAYQQRSSGTSELTFPAFHQHSSGVSTSASAYAAGSVVGVAMPPTSLGSIGTNQNVTIDVSH